MNTARVNKTQKISVVLDSNIIVSSIIFGGKPRDIFLLAIEGKIKPFISPFIIFEVKEVLRNKFDFEEKKLEQTEGILKESFAVIAPKKSLNTIKQNVPDNKILACALESKADYLVTGDKKHILPLKKIKNTKIVTAEDFLKQFTT